MQFEPTIEYALESHWTERLKAVGFREGVVRNYLIWSAELRGKLWSMEVRLHTTEHMVVFSILDPEGGTVSARIVPERAFAFGNHMVGLLAAKSHLMTQSHVYAAADYVQSEAWNLKRL